MRVLVRDGFHFLVTYILVVAKKIEASVTPIKPKWVKPKEIISSNQQRSFMINIYTDGACKGNPGPGGWGASNY